MGLSPSDVIAPGHQGKGKRVGLLREIIRLGSIEWAKRIVEINVLIKSPAQD